MNKPYRPDQFTPKPERDFLLLSVQRTGTRFVQRILTEAGIKTAQIHAVKTREKQIEDWLTRNDAEDLPIIVPLRHPFSVAHSWMNRGDIIMDDMFEQWRLLMGYCERSRVLFLPVDHSDRYRYLHKMSVGVGELLSTDWKPYGHKAGTEFVGHLTRQHIDLMLQKPFFSKFYNGDVPHGTWRADHE